MDFFRSQRRARQRTLGFLALFILTVTLVVILASTLVWFGCYWASPMDRLAYTRGTAVAIVLIILGACLLRSYELRSGGGAVVAQHLGGEPLPASRFENPEIQRFYNIAEEMAIASRTPMPLLYWLPQETTINAFVAGFTPSDAVLAVTRGALEHLNRDELQGVVAHEFSHLLNGDMRLNTQVSSWLFGVYAVYTYGHNILNTTLRPSIGTRNIRPGAFWPLVYVFGGALTAIGYVGLLGGRLLQAAISRQREHLADASAVQFTRQTVGLSGALKKIYFASSLLRSPQADAYNHFFLGEAVEHTALFASHPPLIDRIRALDPSFNPDDDPRAELGASFDADALHQALPLYFQSASGASTYSSTVLADMAFSMRDGIALLFANLIDTSEETIAHQQIETITADWGNDTAFQTRSLEPAVHTQPLYLRLTRLRLMLVHLHTLSAAQQATLRQTLHTLIAANDRISLLEAVIAYLVEHYLCHMAHPGRVRIAGPLLLPQCADEIALLEDILHTHTNQRPVQITLDELDRHKKTATTRAQTVEKALDRLNRLTWSDKKSLFQMLYKTASTSSNAPSPAQQEILSLLAVCLHVPPLDVMIDYPGSHLTLAAP